ncbi:MAG TPA: VOC family protein [Thermoanaerobaculia bacterium]|jgi:catechol 2,3-dioxygenase-like lactoylglutathione lyase family enzyme|nr:VOC family protein [Thermoanaerobaculia bacterium]
MRVAAGYPVFITTKLKECRAFYERLGFSVVFEATWFLYLSLDSVSLAFMTPDHPSSPPDPGAFVGDGAFFTLQVEDAAAAFDDVTKEGLPIAYPLTSEPWGQRRFALVDPAGVWVDVVEQTQPADGFWDPYIE